MSILSSDFNCSSTKYKCCFSALTKWKAITDCSQPCGGGLIRNNRMCIKMDGYNPPSDYISCEDAELEASFECNVQNCTGKKEDNYNRREQ